MNQESSNLIRSMTRDPAPDGQPAKVVLLKNSRGMQVVLMDMGATWLSCTLPVDGQTREVVLGPATMPDHQKQIAYMGATVGRYANRIAAGRFAIDGREYQLDINQAGNTLHGGPDGFDKRRWQIAYRSDSQVDFTLESPDGDQGFPGHVTVLARYRLTEENRLEISYKGESDRPTPLNMTNHAYFNLQGEESGSDILSHRLQINADQYLPTNENGIPLGELAPVENSGFDFRKMKRLDQDFLADPEQKMAKGYDHSFFLNAASNQSEDLEQPAATAVSPDDRVTMQVFTSKPAMQLYTGNWLAGMPDRRGTSYSDYAGFALETQFLPDSPNHPQWPQPSCLLRPGQEYRYTTSYQFTVA